MVMATRGARGHSHRTHQQASGGRDSMPRSRQRRASRSVPGGYRSGYRPLPNSHNSAKFRITETWADLLLTQALSKNFETDKTRRVAILSLARLPVSPLRHGREAEQ